MKLTKSSEEREREREREEERERNEMNGVLAHDSALYIKLYWAGDKLGE